MRKLSVYNFLSLNGFYKDQNENISWHQHGQEEAEFSAESSKSGNALVFGRVTYQMMASYWPTPMAFQSAPVVAESMGKAEKIVFSNTVTESNWQNTRFLSGDIVEEMWKLKQTEGSDFTLLGSGSIVTQFAQAGLIDSYQLMIDPVAIGQGTPIFNGLQGELNLKLASTRTFKSGVVLLNYVPR